MCFITNDCVDGFSNYQKCSCGKHLWNAKTNNFISAHNNTYFYVSKDGVRFKVPLHKKEHKGPGFATFTSVIMHACVYIIMTVSLGVCARLFSS